MSNQISLSDFSLLFHQAPVLWLVLLPDARFTIVEATDAYLRATLRGREQIIGRGLFDVFPDNPADVAASGVKNLHASLRQVVVTKSVHAMAIQKYDVQRMIEEDDGFDERYWSPINWPVLDASDKLVYIIHEVGDVTTQVLAERSRHVEAELRAHRDRLEELAAERTQALQLANQRLAEDIRHRQRIERALFSEKQRVEITLRSIADAVITIDADGYVEYLNPAAESLLGKAQPRARGRPLVEILPLTPVTPEKRVNFLEQMAIGEVGHGDYRLPQPDGHELILALSSTTIRDSNDLPAGAVIVLRDVTEERLRTERLSYRVHHDALTDLPNRAELEKRLEYAIESTRTHGAQHVLLFIDLDDFKRVNDTAGHAAGDELLRQLSRIMVAHIRHRDTLARMGGDEFACLLEHCNPKQGVDIAWSLLKAIREFSLLWEGQSFMVGASIGAVPIEGGKINISEAMQTADAACYAVKAAGRNNVRFLRPGAGALAPATDGWPSRLVAALTEGRFELAIQPIEKMADAHIHAYEVLLRLQEDRQTISAAAFMPAAERHQLASDIDRWVARHTFALLASQAAPDAGTEPTYFINVSSATLTEGKLIELIQEQLQAYSMAPQRIGFEIPEIVLMQHFREAREFAQMVKSFGCRLALDDFANALPVAQHLKTIGIDLLKISAHLVGHASEDAVSRAMIDAINRVSHAIGAATVAKGPESQDDIETVRALGIDYIQGNLISAPQPLMCPHL